MSDLIDRAAAIYIASGYCHPANIAKELKKLPSAQPEQDCILKQFGDCSYSETGCSDCAIKVKIRKALLSAQPDIIHCKDCKYWDKTWTNDWAKDYHYCPNVDGIRKVDFYCADAERRTDDKR